MSKRKPMRPRLEIRDSSMVSGSVDSNGEISVFIVHDVMGLRDAKRLHAFLGKAIAYLAARKERR